MAQTLTQALHLATTGKSAALTRAANYLIGLPEGGWPETMQARERILAELPIRSERSYTLSEWIAAAYRVEEQRNAAGIYRSALWSDH